VNKIKDLKLELNSTDRDISNHEFNNLHSKMNKGIRVGLVINQHKKENEGLQNKNKELNCKLFNLNSELSKAKLSLEEYEKGKEDEYNRKLISDDKNMNDDIILKKSKKQIRLDTKIDELKNRHSENIGIQKRDLDYSQKLDLTNLKEKLIKFNNDHEEMIVKIKEETEKEIIKNRGIINFDAIEIDNLGLKIDWDMNDLEMMTEQFEELIEEQNHN